MFGIDLRPILSQLLGGVDLSGVPVELALPVALTVLFVQGVKWADGKFFMCGLKPFYGAVTMILGLLLGAAFAAISGKNPMGVLSDAVATYIAAVSIWAAFQTVYKPVKSAS